MRGLPDVAVVVVAHVLAHGLTAWLVTPLQSQLLPNVTAFASLVYLPHGVRVLSTWLMGRSAILPLCLGAFLSELLFTPDEIRSALNLTIFLSILVGACSAYLAFELMRLFGFNLYAGQTFRMHWKWLLLVGILASILNSIGQAIVFSGEILAGQSLAVLTTYAAGDLIGLVVTTLALMLIFRWARLFPKRE